MNSNYTIRDEIREYWSTRADTFDLQAGHEIFSETERVAWLRLFDEHLGEADARMALDLACGTGVISHLLHDSGFNTTGADWSEAMLDRAREKSKSRKSDIQFIMADVENIMLPEESQDVLITRHLVWTLVDPSSAFDHWYKILKPGGKILIVDGDFVTTNWFERFVNKLSNIQDKLLNRSPTNQEILLKQQHNAILQKIYFKNGARSDEVAQMLSESGFQDITIETDLSTINKAQAKNMPLLKSLIRRHQHRYAISARK